MRLNPNWIGGGATRPITQAWINYTILAALWVNNLDEHKATIVDGKFASYLPKGQDACRASLQLGLTAYFMQFDSATPLPYHPFTSSGRGSAW